MLAVSHLLERGGASGACSGVRHRLAPERVGTRPRRHEDVIVVARYAEGGGDNRRGVMTGVDDHQSARREHGGQRICSLGLCVAVVVGGVRQQYDKRILGVRYEKC